MRNDAPYLYSLYCLLKAEKFTLKLAIFYIKYFFYLFPAFATENSFGKHEVLVTRVNNTVLRIPE